jgi:3-oxoacyl-[acyl-carrier protein] reductase
VDAPDLHGRVALVTGAAGGMGRAIAGALADAGATVALNDRNTESLTGVEAEFRDRGRSALTVGADVTAGDQVRAMVADVAARAGSLDILVNNAGVLFGTRFLDIAEDEWDLVLDVSVKGTFLCSQAAVPHMQRRGWGRIVNLSSTAGKNVSTVGGAHYTAAKAGILGLTRHLAKEVAADGITVNAVCPGLIDTEMVHSTITADAVAAYAAGFPIPRLGRPGEVADLVAFLASDRAGYITGASVDINGGDLMI